MPICLSDEFLQLAGEKERMFALWIEPLAASALLLASHLHKDQRWRVISFPPWRKWFTLLHHTTEGVFFYVFWLPWREEILDPFWDRCLSHKTFNMITIKRLWEPAMSLHSPTSTWRMPNSKMHRVCVFHLTHCRFQIQQSPVFENVALQLLPIPMVLLLYGLLQ